MVYIVEVETATCATADRLSCIWVIRHNIGGNHPIDYSDGGKPAYSEQMAENQPNGYGGDFDR